MERHPRYTREMDPMFAHVAEFRAKFLEPGLLDNADKFMEVHERFLNRMEADAIKEALYEVRRNTYTHNVFLALKRVISDVFRRVIERYTPPGKYHVFVYRPIADAEKQALIGQMRTAFGRFMEISPNTKNRQGLVAIKGVSKQGLAPRGTEFPEDVENRIVGFLSPSGRSEPLEVALRKAVTAEGKSSVRPKPSDGPAAAGAGGPPPGGAGPAAAGAGGPAGGKRRKTRKGKGKGKSRRARYSRRR
jgi:hypothetical protein